MREKRRFYFSDETENFRRPAEPAVGEEVVIRLRGWKASSFHAWVRTETERLPMALAAEEQLPETHAAPVESASPEGTGRVYRLLSGLHQYIRAPSPPGAALYGGHGRR